MLNRVTLLLLIMTGAKPPKGPKKPPSAKEPGRAAAKAGTRPAAPLSHAEVRAIVIGIMLAMFLGALDQTIVATALPTIGRAFHDVENLSWVVTAYLLTATASTPLYGKLSDIYGRRAVMLTGIGIFILGSIACALAPSMTALVLGRGLQGLGGGGLMSLSQTIIADIVTPKERGRYQGYIGAVFASSSIGGPVLGGFLTEHLHWSLIFWINLPLGAAALFMTNSVLKRVPYQPRKHALDIIGALLMMAAAIALLLALTWGGTRFAWLSAPIGLLLLGSVALWALFAWRLMAAKEPFLPLSVLANPVVRCATLAGTCAMGTLVGMTIFIPLYFEVVVHLSASQSGLALIPLMGATVVSSTLTGRAMTHVENYKIMAAAGALLAMVALSALSIWPQLPIPLVVMLLALIGLGVGCVFPVSTVSMQNAAPRQLMGVATGAMNFFRSLGAALVVAILGAIVLGGIGGATGVSVEMLARTASEANLTQAFRFVFLAAALVLAFALAFIVGMEQKPLRGPAVAQPPQPDAPATPVQEPLDADKPRRTPPKKTS
ncbi:MAG: MDR family MFS transporter [Pseudorhodoplanes sp.]|nr:MDR family MFS transporter [Pseudorhodoplanes sp.]